MEEHSTQEYSDRKKRLDRLKAIGINPYPSHVQFHLTSIREVLDSFEALLKTKKILALAGRIKSKRLHGDLLFVDLADAEQKIQLYIKSNELSESDFSICSELLDVGDFIAVKGTVTKTKRGERSLLVSKIQVLTKALRPLPEKWHGLTDIETRFRRRELDLLANPDVVRIFKMRDAFLRSTRAYLQHNECLEVETPILQTIPGGANAKPFITHHNSLHQDMFLRIAPELYLKRLVVGGLSRVFEVARCFRNEGIDPQHNPEFTQIEIYLAYFDFKALMKFTQRLLSYSCKKTLGTDQLTFKESQLSFASPIPEMTFRDSIRQYTDIDIDAYDNDTELSHAIAKKGIQQEKGWGRGKLLDELFKKHVRPKLFNPIFITHHPLSLSPLAKMSQDKPNEVERFQLIAAGMELCNGFSELNDPQDQLTRFTEQERLRSSGDDEAQRLDSAYIESLEYGLPPTAGVGIGVDRIIQLLTNTPNIKEVILFPTLRKK